jgi:hypothetical protein
MISHKSLAIKRFLNFLTSIIPIEVVPEYAVVVGCWHLGNSRETRDFPVIEVVYVLRHRTLIGASSSGYHFLMFL